MPDIFTSSKDTSKEDLKQLFQKTNPEKNPTEEQEKQPSKGQLPEPPPNYVSTEASTDPNRIKPQELKQVAEKTMQQPPEVEDELPEHLQQKPCAIGLFSHYRPNPLGITFVNQERDEKIVLFLRRHFVTNFPWIAITGILLILPPLAFILFRLANLILFSLPIQLFVIMLCFYYLVVLNYALMKFIEWFFHVGIVTRKRLLDLDVDNILQHHLAETNISEVVDVSYSQNGFFQSFFNYGDVHIQTEALKANFEFELAPKPATVSDILTDLRQLVLERAKGGKQYE